MSYPEHIDDFTYQMELLEYAAHLWRASGTTLPPQLHEILHRDKDWDKQVALMKEAQDYFIDEPKRKAAKLP